MRQRLGDLAKIDLEDNDESLAYNRVLLTLPSLSVENRTLISYNLAKILQQMGRIEESIPAYDDVLKAASDTDLKARILVNRGCAGPDARQVAEAVSDLTAVIDSADAPEDLKVLAHMNRAQALSESDPDAAIEDVNVALASTHQINDGERLQLRLLRAQVWTNIGRVSEAWSEITDLERDAARYSDQVRAVLVRLRNRASGTPG